MSHGDAGLRGKSAGWLAGRLMLHFLITSLNGWSHRPPRQLRARRDIAGALRGASASIERRSLFLKPLGLDLELGGGKLGTLLVWLKVA
jgi:hypothetical protein